MSWRLSILSRQRRRGPSRRMPKNVFNQGASNDQKKPQTTPIPKATPPKVISAPPKVAGSVPKPKPVVEKKPVINQKIVEKIVDEIVITEEIIPDKIEPKEPKTQEIVSEQILGNEPKKSRGLKQLKKKSNVVKDPSVQSDRAAALIEQSRKRAMVPVPKTVVKEKVVKPAPRRRKPPKSSYQPANRARRLNRSRHMEYKYEMRKLLQDINVSEEHRSNLLGTIWAKGERQTASDAKLFLEEKMGEGAINEEQKSQLEKVIDNYTIRR